MIKLLLINAVLFDDDDPALSSSEILGDWGVTRSGC